MGSSGCRMLYEPRWSSTLEITRISGRQTIRIAGPGTDSRWPRSFMQFKSHRIFLSVSFCRQTLSPAPAGPKENSSGRKPGVGGCIRESPARATEGDGQSKSFALAGAQFYAISYRGLRSRLLSGRPRRGVLRTSCATATGCNILAIRLDIHANRLCPAREFLTAERRCAQGFCLSPLWRIVWS